MSKCVQTWRLGEERFVRSGDLEIWTEALGPVDGAPLLLIMGASGQGILWHDELWEAFAREGFRVIRYDHRDTGRSSTINFDRHPYTLDDLAADAVAVLDAYGIDAAHLYGHSMGGMVAQIIALRWPDRVKSITCGSSGPLSTIGKSALMDTEVTDLPGSCADYVEGVQRLLSQPAAASPSERRVRSLELLKLAVGQFAPLDVYMACSLMERQLARARDPLASKHHQLAMMRTQPNDRRPFLHALKIPALVLHGTLDPVLRFAHAEALASAIPHARLVPIVGMGHEMPRKAWPIIIENVLATAQEGVAQHRSLRRAAEGVAERL